MSAAGGSCAGLGSATIAEEIGQVWVICDEKLLCRNRAEELYCQTRHARQITTAICGTRKRTRLR